MKRLLLGRPLATARLEHERLGKAAALAIFSSDNMSSVAYATEEILRVLIPAVGVAAFSLVLPISGVIVLIEAVLIFSYRQTIKAYPSAGGAYIVTKDNLGVLPAQLAGVALLVDYVLTVSVSTAAGVQAISSVIPLSVLTRIALALVFVWIIAYGNLLGVRESGRIFAVPTYIFVASLGLTCGVGIYRVAFGHIPPLSASTQATGGGLHLGVAAVGVFVVLRAFASGGAAVTGVEAISNGVPAFRKPEWRNAQTTLVYMGLILGASFLAVSFLARELHVVPVADESKSVLAQIGEAVYGGGDVGHAAFLVLQISTTLILILAANTSFADFPRLASFHAGDAFMPRQLTQRGHKLVFSNGIVALAAAASVIILLFRASVTSMIPLYALGVFTSFTLSQGGMARRHLRVREPGWRAGLLVNGLGALATACVAVIIAIVKFAKGAWIVMVLVPFLVYLLVRVNRIYDAEEEDLLEGLEDSAAGSLRRRRHIALVLVDDVDETTVHAVQYARTLRPHDIRLLHIAPDTRAAHALSERWSASGSRLELTLVPCRDGERDSCLDRYVASVDSNAEVTVVVPSARQLGPWRRLRHGRSWSTVARALRGHDNVSIVAVRGHAMPHSVSLDSPRRMLPRRRHVVLILVGRLDRAVLKAIEYARGIDALDIRAVHAGADPERAEELVQRWMDAGDATGIPLDVEECVDRDIVATIRRSVERFRSRDTEVTVVLPRREYPRVAHRLLHDRTSRSITRALHDEPHMEVVVVPYHIGGRARRAAPASSDAESARGGDVRHEGRPEGPRRAMPSGRA